MKAFLTTAELSEMIGRSPAAIRNLVMRRKIPFRKPGGRLMFLSSEVEKWISQAPGLRLEEIQEEGR
ncbi:MAG: helix-turn-helix domain-containing protein [Pseudomonadota bacterium]